jgi:hypothetical protein
MLKTIVKIDLYGSALHLPETAGGWVEPFREVPGD